MYAVKNSASVKGSTLFVTLSPCIACARIIYSMGIEEIIYLKSYAQYKGLESDEGVDFLQRFGVNVRQYTGTLSNITDMI